MAGLQLSGLASGLDWKSLVDSLISLERTPATRLESERLTNNTRLTALNNLGNRLAELKTAAGALRSNTLFSSRTASFGSAGSSWSSSAGAGAAVGNYTFEVTQLATASRLTGNADIGQGLATSSDVSGVTLSTLGAGTKLTAGEFTINGARITVEPTESLQDLFDRIATATNNEVTASYDPTSDRITLNSSGPITLGAANDTSNFLTIARLHNNGTGTISSSSALGSVSTQATLAEARLRTPISAVDADGDGTFTINGVSIDYNVNTDTISTVLAKINSSSAGVSASFEATTDRITLTNKTTGDVGLSIDEAAGGLLHALGLTTAAGASLTRGVNAEYKVNGGETLISTSNTFSSASHGIAELAVTATSVGAQTVTVGADTAKMKGAIQAFIDKFNAVQTFIDEQTRITSANGKVTASTLSNNREVQTWAQTFRSAAFSAVAGLSGTISRLEQLGIDFTSGTSQLEIKNPSKLDAALADHPGDVEAFFTTANTGLADRFSTLFTSFTGADGTGGLLKAQKEALNKSNTDIERQIADIDRRLESRRAQMEAAFIAMEQAQSKLQQMQTQLTNSFFKDSSK